MRISPSDRLAVQPAGDGELVGADGRLVAGAEHLEGVDADRHGHLERISPSSSMRW